MSKNSVKITEWGLYGFGVRTIERVCEKGDDRGCLGLAGKKFNAESGIFLPWHGLEKAYSRIKMHPWGRC
jgi:hypothetical protein